MKRYLTIAILAFLFFSIKPASAQKIEVIPYLSYGFLMSPNISGPAAEPNYSAWKGGLNMGVQGYFAHLNQNISFGAGYIFNL
ncbi:MAG: hypothetical protein OEZ13_13395 [Spirochaetia bacterium]|nr:hypothetical protein [Spirochaetia bacterium]